MANNGARDQSLAVPKKAGVGEGRYFAKTPILPRRVTSSLFPPPTMSLASRSAQALRAASRRAPRNVASVVGQTQRASYSLLARTAAAAAPSKVSAVQVCSSHACLDT